MSDETFQVRVTIANKLGMHARAATRFVQLASKYPCEVAVVKDGQRVNGKSIMGVLMLAAERGSRLRISARGCDAANAVSALSELVERGFDETKV